MDTTTINYAMEKLVGGFETIAPFTKNITNEYVDFVVTVLVFKTVVLTLSSIIAYILAKKFYKFGLRESGSFNDDNVLSVVGVALCSIGCVITSIASIINLYCMILAIYNPKMYAIHNIISKLAGGE